jgi:sigma-B regulation protein RsbU (phosphoserine phosphatase)
MSRTIEAVRVEAEDSLQRPRPFFNPEALGAAAAELFRQPDLVLRQLDDVQQEMDGLRAELNLLRRRDETLNFYMHRLDEELRLAARLQQDFLPKTLPTLGNIRFHTLFRPAGYVSGDLYDVMRLDENHVGFYIADAVGHGMPAALLTMFIKHALVTKEIGGGTYRLLKPSEALAKLNEAIIEQNLTQATFATAIYGMIDIRTNELTLSCAGHPAPMLLSRNGELEPIRAQGCLLGIFAGEAFEDATVQLHSGDRLVLYTDGIELAFDDEGDNAGEQWKSELVQFHELPADQLIAEFGQSLDRENGSIEPRDDLTMMVIEVQ